MSAPLARRRARGRRRARRPRAVSKPFTGWTSETSVSCRGDVRGHSLPGCGVDRCALRVVDEPLQWNLWRETALRSSSVSDPGGVHGESCLRCPLDRRSEGRAPQSPAVRSGSSSRRLGNRHRPREILGNAPLDTFGEQRWPARTSASPGEPCSELRQTIEFSPRS